MNLNRFLRIVFKSKRPFVFQDDFGMRFQLYPDKDHVEAYMKRGSVSDAQNIIRFVMKTLNSGQRCMDIGAHIGSVSVAMANRVGPSGRVVAVEPDPSNSFRVTQNLLLNGHVDNFFVLPFAVGAEEHVGQLTIFPSSNGWQTLNTPGDFTSGYERFTIRVLVKSFRQALEIADLDGSPIDLVKIDTEGSEYAILNGMRSLLEDCVITYVVFECSDLTTSNIGVSCAELVAFWDELPYSIYEIGSNGEVKPLQLADGQNHIDCVAIADRRRPDRT